MLPVAAAVAAHAGGDRICPIPSCDPRLIGRRVLTALPRASEVRIDGQIEGVEWARAPVASDFVQSQPTPGAAARLRTEARVLVDDAALYVAVRLFDADPAGIAAPYFRRDNEGVSDWVFVEVDSRYDRRSAFSFGLNPRGVQADGAFVDDATYKPEWNAVWEGAARVDEQGWASEFRIPLSQLSFSGPDPDGYGVWGFNVYRFSPRRGESSNWSPRFSGLPGVVSQFNDLRLPLPTGRRRAEATPFVASQIERESEVADPVFAAGTDLRLGLGSSFDLTMTVLPDFGQVEADPSQINLTTFEVFQTERRPFFVEGLDAFGFNAGLSFRTRDDSFLEETPFYSRRVGGAPVGSLPPDAVVVDRPHAAGILAAFKLSGRTRDGWTLGVLGALTRREVATLRTDEEDVEVAVEPAAMTTVIRATRAFRSGESALGGIAGGIRRFRLGENLAGQCAEQVWVVGLDGRHRFGGQAYEVRGWGLRSFVLGSREAIARIAEEPRHGYQRPDADHPPVSTLGTSLTGMAAQVRLAKVAGAWRWSAAGEVVSPGYETNDVGFQRNADWRLVKGDWSHERTREDAWVRRWTFGSDNLGLGWTARGEPRARVLDGYVRADLRSYWDATLRWTRDFPALGLEWLRGGPALLLPTRDTLHLVVNTDQRRPSFAGLQATAAREPANGSWLLELAPQASVRANHRIEWALHPSYRGETVGWQYVAGRNDGPGGYVVARLHQRTVSVAVRADLVFTPRMVLQAYLQPFVSTGRYDRYQRIVRPRAPDPRDRTSLLAPEQVLEDPSAGRTSVDLDLDGAADLMFPTPDGVKQALNGTVVFRWEYRPGSFLTAVWNHRGEEVAPGRLPLGEVIGGFGPSGGTDVFLLKVSRRLGR